MNKHRIFIGLILLPLSLFGLLLISGKTRVTDRGTAELVQLQALVGRLQLTDLALWTEARYSRHPSQADRFTPYQDFPAALEHFPAGSIIAPPRWQQSLVPGKQGSP